MRMNMLENTILCCNSLCKPNWDYIWKLDEFDNDCNKITFWSGRIMGLFIVYCCGTFGMVLTSSYNSSISLSWFSMAFD
jgi:hypothetical protein